MTISPVNPINAFDTPIEYIQATLSKIADQHNVSVEALIQSASSAGPDGPMYLVRVANLARRLDRLTRQ